MVCQLSRLSKLLTYSGIEKDCGTTKYQCQTETTYRSQASQPTSVAVKITGSLFNILLERLCGSYGIVVHALIFFELLCRWKLARRAIRLMVTQRVLLVEEHELCSHISACSHKNVTSHRDRQTFLMHAWRYLLRRKLPLRCLIMCCSSSRSNSRYLLTAS